MIKKTIFFSTPAYLSLRDRQLVISVSNNDGVKKEVTKPIEDLGVVVLENRQITITSGALDALLNNNCAVITCDAKCMPCGMLMPLEGNTLQSERFREQIDASIPLKKQLWQQTVQAKILNQYSVLKNCLGKEFPCMKIWSSEVRSGDLDNMEARAAAFYWRNFFDGFDCIPSFSRDPDGVAPNNMLNYGYAILRAIIARSLVASGLLPTLGIHHHNRYNAFCLADDIMEPYRPYIDTLVYEIISDGWTEEESLSRNTKAKLLTIPTLEVVINGKRSPLLVAAQQTTASLSKCFSGELRKIDYPVI
ncbi:MAG: type II CRISPR-associated endonuclease Cas1 [Bacteroidales bacterium]|nr:type II CRISPR-associated endonuclease Cas1 [Bacteroidales bacterium]